MALTKENNVVRHYPFAGGNCERIFQYGCVRLPNFDLLIISLSVRQLFVVSYWFTTDPYAVAFKRVKGTNGRQKTYEIFHICCIFYSGFMCQTTVIFGITKDGNLVLNTLAYWNCFTCRNRFQNGANDVSECLTCDTAFCKKAENFV